MRFKNAGYWNQARGRGRTVATLGPRGGLTYTVNVGVVTMVDGSYWNSSTEDLIVDWGDGTIETVNTIGYLSHSYLVAGIYQVNMTSDSDGLLDISFTNQPQYLVSLDESIEVRLMTIDSKENVLHEMFRDCVLLESLPLILFDTDIIAESAYKILEGTLKLLSVDVGIFSHCPYITNIDYMFAESAVKTIHSDIFQPFIVNLISSDRLFYNGLIETLPGDLFKNAVHDIGFKYLCQGADQLTSISSDLFGGISGISDIYNGFRDCDALLAYPTGLLDGVFTSGVDFSNLFSGCDSMTNDCDDIWNDYPSAISLNAFDGCINLTNYASIPIAWK